MINRIFLKLFLIMMSVNVMAVENHSLLPAAQNTLKTLQLSAQAKSSAVAVSQKWLPTDEVAAQLLNTKIDETVVINEFPVIVRDFRDDLQIEKSESIELLRYEIIAPGAKITTITEQGKQHTPWPKLLVFGAQDKGISMVLDPANGNITGLLNDAGISMTIEGNLQKGIQFYPNEEGIPDDQSSLQCMTAVADQPGDPLADLKTSLMSQSNATPQRGVIDYETVIAIDTDSEWMLGKSNNTTTASSYIISLFANMNVFFERDLSLRLLIGEVIYRIGSAPYPPQSDAFDSLNDFGEYWRLNNDNISRDFTALLSGQNIAALSFSGIAWINQYCENGFTQAGGTQTVGSYSVNRIGSSLSTGFTAQFLAHELGHNMGSPHTHCYVPTVDVCYNAEAGCYAGAVACPAGGSGSIMSYCHFGGPNGADCGLNDEDFHPTVISLIDTQIVSNFPSCIQTLGSDIIFINSFE